MVEVVELLARVAASVVLSVEVGKENVYTMGVVEYDSLAVVTGVEVAANGPLLVEILAMVMVVLLLYGVFVVVHVVVVPLEEAEVAARGSLLVEII
jgi:hypothetical protein